VNFGTTELAYLREDLSWPAIQVTYGENGNCAGFAHVWQR